MSRTRNTEDKVIELTWTDAGEVRQVRVDGVIIPPEMVVSVSVTFSAEPWHTVDIRMIGRIENVK